MTDEAGKCPRCGEDHAIVACPYVKAVEFDFTGMIITRVEFLTPSDYARRHDTEEDQPELDYPRLTRKAAR